MDTLAYILTVHSQNKKLYFLECVLLNNDTIFIKKTIYKYINNQNLMYISILK